MKPNFRNLCCKSFNLGRLRQGQFLQCDKAQLKHNLGTEGAKAEYAAHDVKDWRQPQRKEEGRGWAKAKATTSDNTYTGKGGSKRDD